MDTKFFISLKTYEVLNERVKFSQDNRADGDKSSIPAIPICSAVKVRKTFFPSAFDGTNVSVSGFSIVGLFVNGA